MTSPTNSERGVSPKQTSFHPSPIGKKHHHRTDGDHNDGGVELDERRISQREKQIGYGRNTEGYTNMLRLIEHDPRMVNGGVLPLEPPAATLKISKRSWDLNVRRWRRALHMFDYIYLEGTSDAGKTTLPDVVELQRQQWVNPQFASVAKINRVKHRVDDIMAARQNRSVPQKLPVEEALISVLRSPEYYDPVQALMPESNSFHTTSSPQNAGYKILIAPVTQPRAVGGPLPGGSSARRGVSPLAQRIGQRSPSPIATQGKVVERSTSLSQEGSPTYGAVPYGSSPGPSSPLHPATKVQVGGSPLTTPTQKQVEPRSGKWAFRSVSDSRSPSPPSKESPQATTYQQPSAHRGGNQTRRGSGRGSSQQSRVDTTTETRFGSWRK